MLRNLKQKKKEIRRRKGNERKFFSMPFDTSSIETRKDQQVMKIFAFAEKSWSGGSKREEGQDATRPGRRKVSNACCTCRGLKLLSPPVELAGYCACKSQLSSTPLPNKGKDKKESNGATAIVVRLEYSRVDPAAGCRPACTWRMLPLHPPVSDGSMWLKLYCHHHG